MKQIKCTKEREYTHAFIRILKKATMIVNRFRLFV